MRLVIEAERLVERVPSVLRVRPAPPPPTGPPGGSQGQAALALEPRELWVAAHVPGLPLAALHMPERVAPRRKAVKKKLDQTGIKVLSMGVTGIPADEPGARKLFQFAKVKRAHDTGGDTRGLLATSDQILAAVAFGHHA